ncbi:hypothetical protein AB0H82_10225 [Streptomyces sp. NPDC050732]|uniref:hypothetical protein n=1 Tax=Streptomyces sp. NPDC050732 TaxID=3154632 RepID=UPI0034257E01
MALGGLSAHGGHCLVQSEAADPRPENCAHLLAGTTEDFAPDLVRAALHQWFGTPLSGAREPEQVSG